MNRRTFLTSTLTTAAAGLLTPWDRLLAADARTPGSAAASQRYRIAVCDWMILKRQKLGAFKLTHEIGDGSMKIGEFRHSRPASALPAVSPSFHEYCVSHGKFTFKQHRHPVTFQHICRSSWDGVNV